MKIPKFWARATATGTTARGKTVSFSCWRPSDTSESDAHQSALESAKRVLDAFLAGRKPDRYAYGSVPLREEITNEVAGEGGEPAAVVTRNLYGALILNAQRVMFVDVDFPPPSVGAAAKQLLTRLFGRATKSPTDEHEDNARNRVEQFVADNPGWNIRLYRTFAGMRGIVTHDLFDPTSDMTMDILRRLDSDPLYVRLCRAQGCFRARLTPKPWRCGHHANTVKYPIVDPELAARHERWKADYEARHRRYATCRLLGDVGSGVVHPEVGRIIELHDFVSRVGEPLALA